MVVLGVDLRASSKRPSTVVALDGDPNVVFFKIFSTDVELHEMVQSCKPDLIAIGAPLGLPDGLCCLEPDCACAFSSPLKKGRQSEIELARLGISCFFTNKGSIIRNLIYRSIQLNRQLGELGYPVIEVYPHATKMILFGDKAPPKNSPASVPFLKERLTPLIQGLDPHLDGMDRNTCDAVLNAYTGFLHHENSTDMLGSQEDGMLVLPQLPH
ncbi:MAG: hypothetical protein BZY88_00090 [SAR202 cluster bacterium Io17-Chloro-G9]|nr:MAG: hypothetical protein BZY88_00090 [SAR202 cluster bacterium Io17-Chloro-G9]